MKPIHFAFLFVAFVGFLAGRFLWNDSSIETDESYARVRPESGGQHQLVDKGFQESSPTASIEASLEKLLQESNAWEQIYKVTVLCEGWDSFELKAAAEYLTYQRKQANAERLLSVILTRWSGLDAAAALAHTIELHDLREEAIMRLVLEQLKDRARQDFDAVWQYANRVTGDKELAGRLRYAALSTLAESNPGSALEYYSSLDKADRVEGVVRAIAAELAKVDLPRAKALLDNASKREQEAILSGIMSFYSESDPEAGLAYLSELPVNLAHPYSFIYTLVAPWVRRTPGEAIAAIQRQLGGDLQQQSIGVAISMWSQQDLDGAISWLLPLLDEPVMIGAWRNLSHHLVRSDPIRGFELILAHPELDEVKD
ncbi:MAG: hypothetical protein EA353_04970, partial [Puniceicoccaceae bacterium]